MINFQFEKLDIVDSTNDYLFAELNSNNLNKDKIVIAREQTNGHGLNNNSFISDRDYGIYFSFLHFYDDVEDIKYITQKAAVAVYETFKKIFDIELSIKWINDLLYNNKKVCGILCKNIIKHKAVIVGIGIDLFENKNINESIKNIAGYIFKDKYELLKKLEKNQTLNNISCIKKNIYNDFKTLKIDGLEINDQNLWEPDHIVIDIVMRIYSMFGSKEIPKIYIEKNIIKDKKIYEDCEF